MHVLSSILLVALFCVVVRGTTVVNPIMSNGDTTVVLTSQGGDVSTNIDKKTSSFSFVLLEEQSSANIAVGTPVHSITNFPSQLFNYNSTLINVGSSKIGSASAVSSTGTTAVSTVGTLSLTTSIATGAGTLENPLNSKQSFYISAGDVAYTIELSNWTPCSPCADGTAATIEVQFEIKGSGSSVMAVSDDMTAVLDGTIMQLYTNILVDNVAQIMPGNTLVINNNVITIRFPASFTTASYTFAISGDFGLSAGVIVAIVIGSLIFIYLFWRYILACLFVDMAASAALGLG